MFSVQLSYDVKIEARSATPARHAERAIAWRALRRSPAGRRLGSIDGASLAHLWFSESWTSPPRRVDSTTHRQAALDKAIEAVDLTDVRFGSVTEALDRFDEIDRASFADSLERFVSALDEVVAARTQLARNQFHDKSSRVETARG